MLTLPQFIKILKKSSFEGDIHQDWAAQVVFSTDNSPFQMAPQLIVQPKGGDDLSIIFAIINDHAQVAFDFTVRGGGTSTNGQSLGVGVLIDMSKYLTRIKKIDCDKEIVIVEPGVILDQLNHALRAFGYRFPISISPSSRATIGGMVNTNAAGEGSRKYGAMCEWVDSMKGILACGKRFDTKDIHLNEKKYEPIRYLSLKHQSDFIKKYKNLKRQSSGYRLDRAIEKGGLNLNPILIGSEGTLAVIDEITLHIEKIPSVKWYAVIEYASHNDSILDALEIVKTKPASIENIDSAVVAIARDEKKEDILKKTRAMNFIECFDEDEYCDKKALEAMLSHNEPCRIRVRMIKAPSVIQYWKSIRKNCVGWLSRKSYGKQSISGIEDSIVPIENFYKYLTTLKYCLKKFDIEYAMYGHVDVGCLHVRPRMDLRSQHGRGQYYQLINEVALIVQQHNGVMWGEHGIGVRGQYIESFYGKNIFHAICAVKKYFDPKDVLNRGKVAHSSGNKTKINSYNSIPLRAQSDAKIEKKESIYSDVVLKCNGNAACFNKEEETLMCPSYKVTGDRVHSPKGRSELVRAWLIDRKNREKRYAVMKAMKGCLGCKACLSQCPTSVNIPKIKSFFMSDFYQHKKIDCQRWLMAYSDILFLNILRLPRLIQSALYRMQGIFGWNNVPLIKKSQLFDHCRVVPKGRPGETILIVQDWLTRSFNPDLYEDTLSLIKKMGKSAEILPYVNLGLGYYHAGMMKQFKAACIKNNIFFKKYLDQGYTLIGLESSIVMMLREEYSLFSESIDVHTVDEWLLGQQLLIGSNNHDCVTLFLHCHEVSYQSAEKNWQKIFDSLNVPVDIVSTGCCGMAGDYGMKKENINNAKILYTMHWSQHLEKNNVNLMTGFSCRHQAQSFEKVSFMHPLQWILKMVK